MNAPDAVQLEGVVFTDGTCVIKWRTAIKSASIFATFDEFMAVHGHPEINYGTELVWIDDD